MLCKTAARDVSVLSVAQWSANLNSVSSQIDGNDKRVGGGLRGSHGKACCVKQQHNSQEDHHNLSRHHRSVEHRNGNKHRAAACRKAWSGSKTERYPYRPVYEYERTERYSLSIWGSANAASGRLMGTELVEVVSASFFGPSRSSNLRNDGCIPPSE